MSQSYCAGFNIFFYTVVKCNFPELRYTRRLFPEKKENENPLYYLETVIHMDYSFIKFRLLVALIICFNHFRLVPPMRLIGIKEWDNFVNMAHSEPGSEDKPQFDRSEPGSEDKHQLGCS